MDVLDFVFIFGFLLLSDITVSKFGRLRGYCGVKGQCCANYWMKNGSCEACPDGLFGVNCSSTCPLGYYGKFCLEKCICAPGPVCLPTFHTRCDCGSPPIKENADLLYLSTSAGSKAVYTCHEGYNGTTAMDNIICLENGMWESPSISCQLIDCGLPPTIESSRANYPSTKYGSATVYICNNGYTQSGYDKIKCLKNGTWEESSLECHLTGSGANDNMLYFIGVTVAMGFIVTIIVILMIFRHRLRSFSRRYIGVAYTTGTSKCAEDASYTDLRLYSEMDKLPNESPVISQLQGTSVGTLRLQSIPISGTESKV